MNTTTDAFDYISVMVSVNVGLGMTRLLAGIGDYIPIRHRVKTYWVHSCWILVLLLLTVHIWWSFWELRGVRAWTSGEFVWILLGPGSLVIASYLAVPDLRAESLDLERYYFDTNTAFFGLLAVTIAWGIVTEPILGLRAFLVGFRPLQILAIALVVACAISKDRRVHAVATIAILFILSALMFVVRHRVEDLTVP